MANPDILDSKIKKLRIELPHYNFNHSASGESQNFVGRKQILKKLKTLVEATTDKTGVYLVTGNRGVGKTSLVNQVIKQTSLQTNSMFFQNLEYLFILLFSFTATKFFLQKISILGSSILNFIILGIFGAAFLSSFILLCFYNGYSSKNLRQQKRYILLYIWSAIRESFLLINPYNPYRIRTYLVKVILVICSTQFISKSIFLLFEYDISTILFVSYLLVAILFTICQFVKRKWRKRKKNDSPNPILFFLELIFNPIKSYIKNNSRLYLRINFGYKLKDEKEILRLITRTLSTEYNKYHHSIRRLLLWRIIAFCFLCLSAYTIVEKVGTERLEKLYNISFEVFSNDFVKKDNSHNVMHKFLFQKEFLFVISFFSIYTFCILLFRSNWFANFLVTHRIIMRQLEKLNSDITYSTELEKSINIQKDTVGIEAKTKKTRNIADAREMEKELQDILDNIQRIPIFMCRPDIVIVFDELDKVEPDDSNLEKEAPRTKASLFSIDTAREKQTEILKILSNMKYFLSTVKAKFIFIAGREMYDIYLADVSDRNNYIGSIFNAVIYVPSFLTDHSEGSNGDITSLTEEFVCCRLIPHDYYASYDLTNYKMYLEEKIYNRTKNKEIEQKIQKIIAVLQQFIIYLAHVSKGAPKKMMQLFESFIEIREFNKLKEKDEDDKFLVVQRYTRSWVFLTFNYYNQYTLGIIAYMIMPIFNRLSESNIKEHSDKLLVSSLRFVDFLFKFHKHPFSWKHLDVSPEMLEVNRAPELKSVAADLLNYLAQLHINKANFSFSDYEFDNLIADEIFVMTKTDEVFSALFSFSLDETLSLKKHYQDLLEKTQKKYMNNKNSEEFIGAISSLQVVLGDLHYYDDELDDAGVYYENAIQALRNLEQKNYDKESEEEKGNKEMTLEQLYLYVRNMLRLGMIYEKRKQYDFAYLTYGELCKRIIRERDIAIRELKAGIVLRKNKDNDYVFIKASAVKGICTEKEEYYDNIEAPKVRFLSKPIPTSTAFPQPLYFKDISPNTNEMLFKKMTFEGLKILYLPFIAKLQVLEKSHTGGIARNHLEQLEKEFKFLTFVTDHEDAKLLEAEFYSRLADILYCKNSDLKCKKDKNRGNDTNEDKSSDNKSNKDKENYSCTACYYYHKALSILLDLDDYKIKNKNENTVIKLLSESVKRINQNYNVKYCTVLARILSDWGNVFFSCDKLKECGDPKKCKNCEENEGVCKYKKCYILDSEDSNTYQAYKTDAFKAKLKKYINYIESESKKENRDALLKAFGKPEIEFSKMEIAFAMYAISLKAYTKANLHKRSAYQIFKMLRLFKYYEIDDSEYIKELSQKAIRSLWHASEELNTLELNKRRKDFGKNTVKEYVPLQYILVDNEINRIRILVKYLELKSDKTAEKLREYYDMYIASPYGINYSIVARIYQLWLKSIVNYKAYQMLIYNEKYKKEKDVFWKENDKGNNELKTEIKFLLYKDLCDNPIKIIFKEYFKLKNYNVDKEMKVEELKKMKIEILEKLIAETIFCFKEIIRLSKTMGETYLFNNYFMGSIHKKLSFWVRRYEVYKKDFCKGSKTKIDEYLENYLGEEWREQLSGYYENHQALLHYYKCLEMHNEGRAYHNMIDSMCYLKDDYNDRSDHFNIAEERHNILNNDIEEKIKNFNKLYKESELYKVDNYFEKIDKEDEADDKDKKEQ
ncbi:MAG: AAA family ATPase [Fibromonadales bacterium]|nr:AAA family ATPase [Fibromonadales bacterium]